MALCKAACATPQLVAIPEAGCNPPTPRFVTPSFLIAFTCDTELPNPAECVAIKPLFDDGSIVISPKLANVNWDEPAIEDVILNDCDPALEVTTQRVLNFEDRNMITSTTGSPAVVNKYVGEAFWNDKRINYSRIRWGMGTCNGDIFILRDPETLEPAFASFRMFKTYERAQTQGGKGREIKRGVLRFALDPLLLEAPDFNLNDCGIEMP